MGVFVKVVVGVSELTGVSVMVGLGVLLGVSVMVGVGKGPYPGLYASFKRTIVVKGDSKLSHQIFK